MDFKLYNNSWRVAQCIISSVYCKEYKCMQIDKNIVTLDPGPYYTLLIFKKTIEQSFGWKVSCHSMGNTQIPICSKTRSGLE
jgi:hypothetical protein